MTTAIAIGVGAFFGAISRYGISVWIGPAVGTGFPWATFLINVSGSFLLGLLMRAFSDAGGAGDLRAMATTGFCGGYTTFSAFSFELVLLLQNGHRSTAVVYALASMISAPLACWAGYLLGGFGRA